MTKRKTARIDTLEDDEEVIQIEAPNNWLENLYMELGEEAKALVKTAVEAPEELLSILAPKRPTASRKALKAYMIDVLDWSPSKVERVSEEISLAVG